MEIFKDFGINPYLLVAQVVNFLIVLYLLKRFLYKPVLSMLKKREDEIKEGLKQAEEGKLSLESAKEEERKILEKANQRAEKILNDSKKEAEEERTRFEENAKKEAERILLTARETIEKETKEAEERLTQKVGDIALSLLEKSLVGIFGEKEQKEIMRKAVAQIKKDEEKYN